MLALPACPESGYFHNCFGTKNYVAKYWDHNGASSAPEGSAASKAFKELESMFGPAIKLPVAPQITTYVGEFKNDMRDGNGVFTEYGTKYEGEWKNDKRHGKGLLIWSDGHIVFFGNFMDDKRFGYGQLLLSNGDIYIGEFDDGYETKKSVWLSNDIVTEWADAGISGQGIMIYADGRVSLGEWKNGIPHGLFIEYASDKKIINSGIYIRGKLREPQLIYAEAFPHLNILPPCQGVDVKTWSNCVGETASINEAGQSSYYGEFEKGSFNGRGKYFYGTKGSNPVSGVYRGEFKEGRFHGLGVHSFEDEKFKVQIGEWREGKLHRFFLDVAPVQENKSPSYGNPPLLQGLQK